jgi:hypothetical protein
MTKEKFASEVKTVHSFIARYCSDNKHAKERKKVFTCKYHAEDYSCDIHLCHECLELLEYSVSRLQNCPHEEKPKCRRCPNPCYEKKEWKKMAKVMRQSAIMLGIEQIKEKVMQIFIKDEK